MIAYSSPTAGFAEELFQLGRTPNSEALHVTTRRPKSMWKQHAGRDPLRARRRAQGPTPNLVWIL